MNHKQLNPGFELRSLIPFLTTITVTLNAPPFVNKNIEKSIWSFRPNTLKLYILTSEEKYKNQEIILPVAEIKYIIKLAKDFKVAFRYFE